MVAEEEGTEEEVGGKSLPEMAVVVVVEEVVFEEGTEEEVRGKSLPFHLRQRDTFCWVCTVQLQRK